MSVSLTVRRITIADAKLIDILTTRTKDQLQKIDDAYVYCYGMTIVSQDKRMVKLIAVEYQKRHPDGETLVASLKSELSG
eukprot:COSAG04_NODE_7361_length_1140_cov_1.920269_2_plen_79_part_01